MNKLAYLQGYMEKTSSPQWVKMFRRGKLSKENLLRIITELGLEPRALRKPLRHEEGRLQFFSNYGIPVVDKDKFVPVRDMLADKRYSKPLGGLWGNPSGKGFTDKRSDWLFLLDDHGWVDNPKYREDGLYSYFIDKALEHDAFIPVEQGPRNVPGYEGRAWKRMQYLTGENETAKANRADYIKQRGGASLSELKPGARVYTIDSLDDLKKLVDEYPAPYPGMEHGARRPHKPHGQRTEGNKESGVAGGP